MSPAAAGCAALLAALTLVPPCARAADDAASAMYLRNAGPDSRPVAARVGPGSGALVRSAQLSCAGCHGTDARGRAEGGLAAPAIDWHRLTKPWGHDGDDGRRRAAYDEATFHRAITSGRDASGNALDPAMPRYQIDAAQSAALFALLRRLDAASVPGVAAEAVYIGYPDLPDATSALAAMRAVFDSANRSGGAHGRELRLVALRPGEPAPAMVALACPLPLATGRGLVLPPDNVPTLGCAAPSASARPADFGLLPGLQERADMLAAYARQALGIPAERVWTPSEPLPGRPPAAVVVERLDAALVARMADWDRAAQVPWVLVAAGESIAGRAMPYSTWPEAWRARTLAALPLPPAAGPATAGERLGDAAGRVMVEALRMAGRDLTPERLAGALGRVDQPQNPAMPRIRFETARRVGLHGIHVAGYDEATRQWAPRARWFEP